MNYFDSMTQSVADQSEIINMTGTTDVAEHMIVENDIEEDSGYKILYITFAVIFGILSVWIIIIIFTGEDGVKILNEMLNSSSQTKLASDL